MHPQRNVIKEAYNILESVFKGPQEFRVKKLENGGRRYNFEGGGSVNISVDDDDRHTVTIDHDNRTSIAAALDHHISKTPGGPSVISVENKSHRPMLRDALDRSEYDYRGRQGTHERQSDSKVETGLEAAGTPFYQLRNEELGKETKKNTSPEDMAELIRKGIEAALKKRLAGKNDDTDSPHYKITAGEDHEEARRALRMD